MYSVTLHCALKNGADGALGRLRQENGKFKSSIGYTARSYL
jgi:hypothetical protein